MPPYYQRVPFRLLRLIQQEAAVRVQARTVRVPLGSPQSLSLLYWKATWKTALIGTFLQRQPGAFLDIGVNVGTTLFDFLATGRPGPYLGFEPNSACASFCARLIARNELSECHIVPVALSNFDGLGKLHLQPGLETDPSATLAQEIRPGQNVRTEYVACCRFDSIRPALEVERVSLLKIDVEGAELSVLEGMSDLLRRDRPLVICEVLHADANIAEDQHRSRTDALAAQLAAHGYHIFHLRKDDRLQLAGFAPLTEFPFIRWTPERAEECDYLFVPEESIEEVTKLLGVASKHA